MASRFPVKHLALLLVITLPLPALAGNYTPMPPPPAASPVADQKQAQVQHQMQRQGQRQSQATAQANSQNTNVTVQNPVGGGGAIGGGAPVVNFAAPAWSLPSVGASGMDCPTVGFSAGGSGPMGGGGLGPSWISPHCNARKLAELLYNMGHSDIAMKVLEDEYPVVRAAAPAAAPEASPEKHISSGFADRSAWCSATSFGRWSRAEQARHPECKN